ncbi:hypothetical protein diail_4256 [Diaporthe ilicicola]|nr:hypothetical protein diail_4256 [Diaporthe ilicicola]
MAQRMRASSLPRPLASHPLPPKIDLQPLSGQQRDEVRTLSTDFQRPRSLSPVSRTATSRNNISNSQEPAPEISGAPEKDTGAQKLGRSTSHSRRKSESIKPEKGATHAPEIPRPHFRKADTTVRATASMDQGQDIRARKFEGATLTEDVQMGSQQGAPKPKSMTPDFASDGGSTVVPEAQTCVYVIKQGRSHAIPHRLEPGLLDAVSNALRLRQSQKSVYKKLASLSPGNIAALQAVLDDGGSGAQTRRLVELSILQKSVEGSKEPAVLAIVEDLYPQRPWRQDGGNILENPDYFKEPQTYPRTTYPKRSLSCNDRHQPMHREIGPQFRTQTRSSGRARLVKPRPHREVQDVSRDMMNRDDYQAALTTYRVWIMQQHPSLKGSQAEAQSWTKCTVVEDVRSHDDVRQRLLVLDGKPPSVNMKRLSLRPDQQAQIARLHEAVVSDETYPEYQWSLRQLEVIRSKSRTLQLVPTVSAIIVYLARTPRAHVDLQHLFEMRQLPEDDSSTYMTTRHGAQLFSVPPSTPYSENSSLHYGLPKFHPAFPNGAPPPPVVPDAPYNPYGPPDGYPPPQPNLENLGHGHVPPLGPSTADAALGSKPQTLTDESSQSSCSSSYLSPDHATKEPEKGKTRIPARIISKRALIDLGYRWIQEFNMVVIFRTLNHDQIHEILELSRDYKEAEENRRYTHSNQNRTRRNSKDEPPRPPTLLARAVNRIRPQDHLFEKAQVQDDADESLAQTVADASDRNWPGKSKSPYQQRSLANHPTLRRKASGLQLRSSAIARLGIPQAEARLALEASRARGSLHSFVSDLDLDEARPVNPAQFQNMPHGPQRDVGDQPINQPLWDHMPEGAVANKRADLGKIAQDSETSGRGIDSKGRDDLTTSSVTEDDYCDSSEQASSRDDILWKYRDGKEQGPDLQPSASTETVSTAKPHREEHIKDEAGLALGATESSLEIERLEEQLATLKSIREAKRTYKALMPIVLKENTGHRDLPKKSTTVAVQATKHTDPTMTEQDKTKSQPSRTDLPAAQLQRRVTMDEVQDEANTKRPSENLQAAKLRAGDDELLVNTPTRASTIRNVLQNFEAGPDLAQRVVQDGAASVEQTDHEGPETAYRGRSRRHVRAAHREASRKRLTGECHGWRERQS